MFISTITGTVTELTPNNQTRFQCTVTLNVPLGELANIEPGRLIATENVFFSTREKRYTILQITDAFPAPKNTTTKKTGLNMTCIAVPLGQELTFLGVRKGSEITPSDTFPDHGGQVKILDDEMTRTIIHHIAPDSRVSEHGHRIDIGSYRSNPNVSVGMDPSSLLRGNAALISARPRARTTMTYNLISTLLQQNEQHVHIVYLDVNNMGTLSLSPLLSQFDNAGILALNDKFIPPSVFHAMRNQQDRLSHKRAVLDFLDMMILPSVLEERRHDFSYAVSAWMRTNKIAIYRPNEQTIDQFINDIRVDILDGADEDAEEYITELMNGIAETYRGERFQEKNTRDLLDMIEEFNRDARILSVRRTLYDLKAEIASVFETYSKDIPSAARRSIQDIISQLNDDTKSSLLVVQGHKTTDTLRFVGTLSQALVDERVKRLKIRTPVLFIFNNIDDYISRNGNGMKEIGSDRFADSIQLLQANGRRHGLGFCVTAENSLAIDPWLARRIQSYFIGPITFVEEPGRIANLLNVSEDLVRPAIRYEDGDFLFISADSAYHRRVPLPVFTPKNTTVTHAFLDTLREEQERRRQDYLAQETERKKRAESERNKKREERSVTKQTESEESADSKRSKEAQKPRKNEIQSSSKQHDTSKPPQPLEAEKEEIQVGSTATEVEGDELFVTSNSETVTLPAETDNKIEPPSKTRQDHRSHGRKRGGREKNDKNATSVTTDQTRELKYEEFDPDSGKAVNGTAIVTTPEANDTTPADVEQDETASGQKKVTDKEPAAETKRETRPKTGKRSSTRRSSSSKTKTPEVKKKEKDI